MQGVQENRILIYELWPLHPDSLWNTISLTNFNPRLCPTFCHLW